LKYLSRRKVDSDQRYSETRRVTLIGAVIDLVLGIAKILIGVVGHSHGLVADGVHSLSDLMTDGLVIWAAKYGTQKADAEHPYGHERIQTISTVLLGLALIIVALLIAYDAVGRLLSSETMEVPGNLTLAVASISILAKEWIYRYTMRVARRIRSKLLTANAWHSRSDALSSLVVLAGIIGSMLGLNYLDTVAAIVVAAMIVHVGWRLGWDSVHELVDTGLDKKLLESMRKTMLSIEDVRDIHQLRTRRMGPQVIADVHVIVRSDISVSEGHRISEEVERMLVGELDDPADITVHIDHEEDEAGPPAYLPLRGELMPALRKNWLEISSIPIERVALHYIGEKISIDLTLSPESGSSLQELRQFAEQLQQKYADDSQIGKISVYLSVS
jgi:cation diffusion facilitator family transporter